MIMNIDPNSQLKILIEAFQNQTEISYIEKEKVFNTSGRDISSIKSSQLSNENIDNRIIDFVIKNKSVLDQKLLKEFDRILSSRVAQTRADLESYGPLSFLFSYFFTGPSLLDLQKEVDRLEFIKEAVEKAEKEDPSIVKEDSSIHLEETSKAQPKTEDLAPRDLKKSMGISEQKKVDQKEPAPLTQVVASGDHSIPPLPPPSPPLEGMGSPRLTKRLLNEPDLPKYKISADFQKMAPDEIQQQIDEIMIYLKELKEAAKPFTEALVENEKISNDLNEAQLYLKDSESSAARFNDNLKELKESKPDEVVYLIYFDKRNTTTTQIPYFPDDLFDEINREKAKLKEAPLPIHLKKSFAIAEMENSFKELDSYLAKERQTIERLSSEAQHIRNQTIGDHSFREFNDLINNEVYGKAKLIANWERALKIRQNALKGKTPVVAQLAQPRLKTASSPLVDRYPDLKIIANWSNEMRILARGEINQLVSTEKEE
jgi:hypothetical protein